jgi:hypothetical protein
MKLYWRIKKGGKWTWEPAVAITELGGNTIPTCADGTLNCIQYRVKESEE